MADADKSGIFRQLAAGIAVAGITLAAIPAAHAATPPQPAMAGMVGITAATQDNRERALRCMTYAIAYEAGREPVAGQQAVGEVILNRMRHPAFPKSVCGVVFQGSARRTGCQFTFTCDGALRRVLPGRIMLAAREVAREVIDGEAAAQIGGATHYHANYVMPYWAPTLVRVGQVGAHIFYRAPGSPALPARWTGGFEPEITGLGSWLTATDTLTARAAIDARAKVAPPPAAPAGFAPWGLPVK